MPAIIETTGLISETMDSLIDFIVKDEFLGKQFENYLIKNKIEIQKESELNDVLIGYVLDGKTEDNMRVLDYFYEKNENSDKKTLEALKKSFVSVFQIKKISKNSYDTFDLIQEKDFTLIPLVKTTSLRGVGLFDFIKARVIEIDNNFYLLEIFDLIGQYKEFFANAEAVKLILKNPETAVLNNTEKFLEIKKTAASFHSSFVECFKKDEVVVSNKEADELLNNFWLYHTGSLEKFDYKELSDNFDYSFFEIEGNENFLLCAVYGFKESEKEYDTGFYSDSTFGLFIIPFLGTLNFSLKNKKLNEDLIKYFLINDNIPPEFLRKKQEEYPVFLEFINKTTGKNFDTIEDVIEIYKDEYKAGYKFSSINVLYNSDTFSKVLGHKEEKENKTIGRNDPCPCGSGKKYKKCCLNKEG